MSRRALSFSLHLTNFRNFRDRTFQFQPPTLIRGPNAIGKTNILEAIFLLATTNSFKKAKSSQLIRQGADFARINFKNQELELEIRLIKEGRQIKKEARIDQRLVNLAEFIGSFSTVIFSPESLHIIKGPPQERRSFLNIVLSQANQDYLYALLTFQKVKRERNRLLLLLSKGQAEPDELDFWDQEMVRSGSRLIKDRAGLAKIFNHLIPHRYQEIAGSGPTPRLVYQTNIGRRSIEEEYRKSLKKSLKRDLKYLTTTKGPHRDELLFYFDQNQLSGLASQGEIRSLAFVLKLAEKHYLEEKKGSSATLLLDDPLSELDQSRSQLLLKLAREKKAIVTILPEELRGFKEPEKEFQIIDLSREKNKRSDR